jgi:hypothetical protein
MKEIIKLDFIKMKSFYSVTDTVKRMRRQVTNWKKMFAKDQYGKGLLSKIYKELLIIYNKKVKNPVKKWGKYLNKNFIKDLQVASNITDWVGYE